MTAPFSTQLPKVLIISTTLALESRESTESNRIRTRYSPVLFGKVCVHPDEAAYDHRVCGIDFLNGVIVKMGHEAGIETPFHSPSCP
jgi:hypothetical protein